MPIVENDQLLKYSGWSRRSNKRRRRICSWTPNTAKHSLPHRHFRQTSLLTAGKEGAPITKMVAEMTEVNAGTDAEQAEHLLLMVNGLFGSSSNWLVVQRNLEKLGMAHKLLVLASNANLKLQTFEGIDACGKRLAEEVQACAKRHPRLKYISVIGHSMGGLIARYTIGKLYDPDTCLIAGLVPRHFITLATPHLGCGGEGPAQVPFIGWTADVPLVGQAAMKWMQSWADLFASTVLRRTGDQFFLLDGTPSHQPLLSRMVEDSDEGYFYSALKAFFSRSCYANSSGDHIVGWANSSVRHPDQLPELGNLTDAKGVVWEDPLESAIRFSTAASSSHQGREGRETGAAESRSGARNLQQEGSVPEAEQVVRSSEAVLRILERLQALPWCRMDTSFKGTKFPYFAHNLIQVTREWLNWEGENVVQHLARHFVALETAFEEYQTQNCSIAVGSECT